MNEAGQSSELTDQETAQKDVRKNAAKEKLKQYSFEEKQELVSRFPKGAKMMDMSPNSKVNLEAARILRKRQVSGEWHKKNPDGAAPDINPDDAFAEEGAKKQKTLVAVRVT